MPACVNKVLIGKMMESGRLVEQAQNNSREQFNNSPDLLKILLDAAMDAESAHTLMSRQTPGSAGMQRDLLSIIVHQGRLWERLRAKASGARTAP